MSGGIRYRVIRAADDLAQASAAVVRYSHAEPAPVKRLRESKLDHERALRQYADRERVRTSNLMAAREGERLAREALEVVVEEVDTAEKNLSHAADVLNLVASAAVLIRVKAVEAAAHDVPGDRSAVETLDAAAAALDWLGPIDSPGFAGLRRLYAIEDPAAD